MYKFTLKLANEIQQKMTGIARKSNKASLDILEVGAEKVGTVKNDSNTWTF